MELDLTRLIVIYIHLVACCAAIGLVLTSDIAMIKKLVKGDASAADDMTHLNHVMHVVSASLIALWISGIAIVSLDVSVKGLEYFSNPKLQAKIAIVLILTINGFLLHGAVMPAIKKFGSLLHLPFNPLMLTIFSGAVSGVSWFYAALLGVGRPLSWKYSLLELLAAYPYLIAGGMAMITVLRLKAGIRGDSEIAIALDRFEHQHLKTMTHMARKSSNREFELQLV
jgi:hypothetical protein